MEATIHLFGELDTIAAPPLFLPEICFFLPAAANLATSLDRFWPPAAGPE
jgi:hypothetical protein